jgi:reactive intermediate/imine deaminase
MAEKSVVRTERAPAPFQGAPYSQAIRAGGLVFVSGQLALEPDHSDIVGETIQEQTEQVFQNLAAILEEAGSGIDKLVKTTVFLVNLGLVLATLLSTSTLGALQARDASYLLFGPVYLTLILPGWLHALTSPGHDSWKTRNLVPTGGMDDGAQQRKCC